MPNVLRHTLVPRESCPTPNYDQNLFRYLVKEEVLDYIWTIPDKISCEFLLMNALSVVPEERALLQYVFDFRDGTLEKIAQKLNKEEYQLGLGFAKDQ